MWSYPLSFLLPNNSAFHCGTLREESERSISAARPQKSEPIEKSDGLNLFRLARITEVIIVGHFNQMVASPWVLSVRLDVFKRTEESSKLQMGKKQTIEEGMVGKAIVMISLCSVFFNKLSLSIIVLLLSILERIIYSSNNRSTLLLFVTPCVRNPRTKHLCSAATKYFLPTERPVNGGLNLIVEVRSNRILARIIGVVVVPHYRRRTIEVFCGLTLLCSVLHAIPFRLRSPRLYDECIS